MQNVPGLIVVLGSPNDNKGVISPIGQGRLLLALEEFNSGKYDGWKLLLTGGFGEHFNTTAHPHAYYAQNFILEKGVPKEAIVDFAESQDTVDDALKAAPILENYPQAELLVISSDFHLDRVKYIFGEVFPRRRISFLGANYLNTCSEAEASQLMAHESRELRESKRNWYFCLGWNIAKRRLTISYKGKHRWYDASPT